MKAVVQTAYGSPDVFELREVERPSVKDDEVLIRVHATSLHAGDVWSMRGAPFVSRFTVGLPKPRGWIPGMEVAGRVEAVGAGVTRFQVGDEVFGACVGGCAEYASTSQDRLSTMIFCKLRSNMVH